MSKNDSLKFILLGDSPVGKSSLLNIIADQNMSNILPTIGVDFAQKEIDFHGKTVKTIIWDASGNKRFRDGASNFCKGIHCIILVYDITNLESFQNLDSWFDVFKNETSF